MGRYINSLDGETVLGEHGKADAILSGMPGSTEIKQPKEFIENLVCVVDNGIFEAAGYAFDQREFKDFSYPDGRPKRWLIVPGVDKIAK